MHLIQLGFGGVGRALVRQILGRREYLARRYGFMLSLRAIADSSAVLADSDSLQVGAVEAALEAKTAGLSLVALASGRLSSSWLDCLPATPCIVVDLTAADGQAPALIQALQAGHRVVLANKRPLCGAMTEFAALTAAGVTRYEATVGAGLPVISTLQALLDSGDAVQRIEACVSGTLGFIASELDAGRPLSAAVRRAYELGYTEPDPRDDLSGADVARKALILARTCGWPCEFAQLAPEPLFPSALADLSREAFLDRLDELDAPLADRVAGAQRRNEVLRYVALVEPAGVQVALRSLPRDHPLAALRGPDNLFSITSDRYHAQPLIVRGPGAGQAVTAAGVLADIVATARELGG
ncbi:MAG: homoserine dehydrogenase [Oscillochloris sp.]|nr:homoserine dehydrogenase [Oscillochloris sp.]